MITIEKLTDSNLMTKITEQVLRDLPEWFGREESLLEYVQNVTKHPFYLASVDDTPAGFISVDLNNGITAEIYVMGIYKKFHRRGVGKVLVNHLQECLLAQGFSLLLVKTLGESFPNEAYSKTRKFYQSCGFLPVQEMPEIWGADTPCLLMIKNL